MSKMDSIVADYSNLLDTYTYLDVQDKELRDKSIKDALKYIEKKYPDKTETEEFKLLKNVCDGDSEYSKNFANMKIVSQSHFDHKADGKSFLNYSGENCTDDPIQACGFKDNDGNLYVAYRGTGNGRWGDNGQGFVDPSTDMQDAAKDYFDHVADEQGYNNLYVTGHSKGGNEAQYVTMTSKHQNDITACYSIDGQGFSDKAIAKFKNNPKYDEILNKMYSIDGNNDPIHKLIGVIIPKENTYYVNTHYQDSNGKYKFAYFHDILGISTGEGHIDFQRDKDGNITHGEEGWLSKFGGVLNDNLQSLPEGMKGACAIAMMELSNMFTGGSMDDAEAGYFDFVQLNNIGIPLVFASITEYATVHMYEKHGVIGAVATCIVATAASLVLLPIVKLAVDVVEGIYLIKKVINSVVELVDKAKKMCQNIAKWANGIFSSILSFINKFNGWLYTQSAGYKYSTANPYIVINTTTMNSYANQLANLSQRAKALDSRMNSLYWHAGFDWNTVRAISNLGTLLKAGIVLDFAYRLDKNVAYLRETAQEFERAEREIVGMC